MFLDFILSHIWPWILWMWTYKCPEDPLLPGKYQCSSSSYWFSIPGLHWGSLSDTSRSWPGQQEWIEPLGEHQPLTQTFIHIYAQRDVYTCRCAPIDICTTQMHTNISVHISRTNIYIYAYANAHIWWLHNDIFFLKNFGGATLCSALRILLTRHSRVITSDRSWGTI